MSTNRRLFPEHSWLAEDWARLPSDLQLHEALRDTHLLITGGTGFFGRWLLALIHKLNDESANISVVVVSRDPARFLEMHPEYRECRWLSWIQGDVRYFKIAAGTPVDLIIHAATDTSVAAGEDPLQLFDSIVGGSRNVFEEAVRIGARRVLLTGSGAQYGRLRDTGGVSETFTGACPSHSVSSVYGEAKRAQETLGAIYAARHGLEVVMTRCFAFSGPGLPLDAHFAIGNFVRDALFKDEVVLNSDGTAVRSYLHGADLAAWLLTLLHRGEPGVAYNVGSDEAISIAELAKRVIDCVAPGKPLHIRGRSGGGERSYYVPEVGRARSLGLDVWTSLDETILGMARWARNCSI